MEPFTVGISQHQGHATHARPQATLGEAIPQLRVFLISSDSWFVSLTCSPGAAIVARKTLLSLAQWCVGTSVPLCSRIL